MNCQKAYLSQVLKARAHLNLEQLERLATWLGFNEVEVEYLLLLLQHDRAGTPSLRQHLHKRIVELKKRRLQAQHRIRGDQPLQEAQQSIFYSSWVYSAVHLSQPVRSCARAKTLLRHFILHPPTSPRFWNF